MASTKNPGCFKNIILEKECLAQQFIDTDDTSLNTKLELEMYGTIQGHVWGHAEGGRAIKHHLLLHKVFSLSFCHVITMTTSARNTDMVALHTKINVVFVFCIRFSIFLVSLISFFTIRSQLHSL
jgi:hypothetical protein